MQKCIDYKKIGVINSYVDPHNTQITGKTMKKNILYSFFLIVFLSNTSTNHGMMTKARRPTTLKKVTHKIQNTTTTYHPIKIQKPVFINRLKQYYNQAKHKVSQFWYGTGYKQRIMDKTTDLVKKIQEKKYADSVQSFDAFLQKKDQDTINNLLTELIFSKNELDFLNARVFALRIGLMLGNKVNKKITHKIIIWTKKNILRLFNQDLVINDDFFLITLLEIDYTDFSNLELITVIHDNLDYIQKTRPGKTFLKLLQLQHKEIYKAIIQRQQRLTQRLKESIKQSTHKLKFKE